MIHTMFTFGFAGILGTRENAGSASKGEIEGVLAVVGLVAIARAQYLYVALGVSALWYSRISLGLIASRRARM
jgi:hypothetical protein